MEVIETSSSNTENTKDVIPSLIESMEWLIDIFVSVWIPWRETWPAEVCNIFFSTKPILDSNVSSTSSRVVEDMLVDCKWTWRRKLALTGEFFIFLQEQIPVIHAVDNSFSTILKLICNLNIKFYSWTPKSSKVKAVGIVLNPIKKLIPETPLKWWEIKSNLILVKFSQKEISVKVHLLCTHKVILNHPVSTNTS